MAETCSQLLDLSQYSLQVQSHIPHPVLPVSNPGLKCHRPIELHLQRMITLHQSVEHNRIMLLRDVLVAPRRSFVSFSINVKVRLVCKTLNAFCGPLL